MPAERHGHSTATQRTPDVRLAGRSREVDILDHALHAARTGCGTLALIHGEAGIGKSALAKAIGARANADGMVFAVGRCYESAGAPPYAPWRDVLGEMTGRIGGAVPEARLPAQFGGEIEPSTSFEIGESVARYLTDAAEVSPIVLLLDDLHWADRESLDLLEHVTRKLEQMAVLLIVTYRVEDVEVGGAVEATLASLRRDRPLADLPLGPLDVDATGELSSLCGVPPTPQLAEYVCARGDGIPLFVLELLRDLRERSLLQPDGDGRWLPPDESTNVPSALAQIFRSRIASRGADVRALLDVAAVAGEAWRLPVLEQVVELPEERLVAALSSALEAHLIEEIDGRREHYRFTHALFRETLYGSIVARRRRHVHRRLAIALEALPGEAEIEALAHHWAAAGDKERTIRYSIDAADNALRHLATHAALRLYEQAAVAAGTAPNAVDPADLVALYRKKAEVHMTLNDRQSTETTFSGMLEAARTAGDTVGECHALCRLSHVDRWSNRSRESQLHADAALALAETIDDPFATANAHFNYAHHNNAIGNLQEVRPHLLIVERLAREHGFRALLVRTAHLMAYADRYHGHYKRAQRYLSEALEIARADRQPLLMSGTSWPVAWTWAERGHYDRAREVLEEGFAIAERSGERHYTLWLDWSMAKLLREVGDYEEAVRWDYAALDESRRNDLVVYVAGTLLFAAFDELALDRVARASNLLSEFDIAFARCEFCRPFMNPAYLVARSDLARHTDEIETALHHAREAGEFSRRHNFPRQTIYARIAEGRALLDSQPPEAVTPFREAVSIADEIGHGALRWQSRVYLAEALSAAGQDNAETVNAAADILDQCLAGTSDSRWRRCLASTEPARRLRRLRSGSDRERGETTTPAGLTGRELEVLGRIARGDTNQMIAFDLGISIKTVSTHVANILRKTKCGNRAGAAAFAIRSGMVRPDS